MKPSTTVELPVIQQNELRQDLEESILAGELEEGSLVCPETGELITWESLGGTMVLSRWTQIGNSIARPKNQPVNNSV